LRSPRWRPCSIRRRGAGLGSTGASTPPSAKLHLSRIGSPRLSAVQHRLAVILDQPEALDGALPQLEALLAAGHAVHLGLGGRASTAAPAIADLCARFPRMSVGYAIGRRDSWTGVAERLRDAVAEPGPGKPSPDAAASMATALPADPGVVAYLRQLDVELVLLAGEIGPASLASEHLSACGVLGLACAELAPTPEAALAQAEAPAALRAPGGDSANFLWRPALWAMRAQEAVSRAGEEEAVPTSAASPVRPGLKAKLGAVYAKSVFPEIAALGSRLAPASRPLLKARLASALDPEALTGQMSAEAAMARAAEGEGPVVLGPWTGDPDLELLYWIPFLRWCRRHYRIDKGRIIAVSRGGCGLWYEGLGTYLDVSELFDEAALRALDAERRQELERRGKKFGVTDADRQVFKRLDRRLAFRGFNVVPPWVLHVLFERYWSGEAGPAFLTEHTRYQPLKIKEKRARQLCPGLSPGYLAMSFEPAANLPDGPETRALAGRLILEAARRSQVAVIASRERAGPLRALVGEAKGVHVVELEPLQARMLGTTIAGAADAFVGSQTWLAYAAAAAGKPVICLQSEPDARQFVHRASCVLGFQPAPVVLEPGQAEALAGALERIRSPQDRQAPLEPAAAH
jgi:hypothetical protein